MHQETHLRILHLDELSTHDMYEFAFAHSFDPANLSSASFWHPEYLYVEDEEWGIGILADAISAVFQEPPGFAWYGETIVSLAQWADIEALTRSAHPDDRNVDAFFTAVRAWLKEGNRGASFFWILGP